MVCVYVCVCLGVCVCVRDLASVLCCVCSLCGAICSYGLWRGDVDIVPCVSDIDDDNWGILLGKSRSLCSTTYCYPYPLTFCLVPELFYRKTGMEGRAAAEGGTGHG